MGCCLSSTKNQISKKTELQQYQSSSNGKEEQASHVSIEEETVKEVLLETPVMTMVPKRSNEEDTIKPMPPEIIRSTTPPINPHYKSPQKDQKGIVPEIDRASYSEVNQRPPARKHQGPTGGMPSRATPRNEGSARRSKSPATRVGRSLGDKSEERAMKPSPNDAVLGEDAESLENPVVSLECFIFL